MQFSELKENLDNLYLSYKHKFSSKDPVWNLHRFTSENDIETIGLITAAYSYGSVEQINRFIDKLLVKIGSKPYEFTINFQKHKDKNIYRNLVTGLTQQVTCSGCLKHLAGCKKLTAA